MDQLELRKPDNQFAKGASRFNITVDIKASDVKKYGVPYAWVGKSITLKPAEWAKIRIEAEGRPISDLKKITDSIRTNMRNEEKDRKKGMPHRNLRMIIGFVRYDKRNITRDTEPKLPADIQAAMDSFLYCR